MLRHKESSGFTLVEIAIAVAIFGIFSLIFASTVSNAFRVVVAAQNNLDIERQRYRLRLLMSCSNTIPAATCGGSNSPMNVRDNNNRVLVASNGKTNFAKMAYRGICLGGRTVGVQYKPTKDAGDIWTPLFSLPLVCPRLPT